MAKEDYLEGYNQGLETGKQGPIRRTITRTLDRALGNPHESAKRGYDQGMKEMIAARKAEDAKKQDEIDKAELPARQARYRVLMNSAFKKGGAVKKMSSGGSVGSASKRADGIAVKGKTRGKIC
jgi:hypothetical protein